MVFLWVRYPRASLHRARSLMSMLCSRKPAWLGPLPGHLLIQIRRSDQKQKSSFSYCTSQNSPPRVMRLDQPSCARAYCMTRAAALKIFLELLARSEIRVERCVTVVVSRASIASHFNVILLSRNWHDLKSAIISSDWGGRRVSKEENSITPPTYNWVVWNLPQGGTRHEGHSWQ